MPGTGCLSRAHTSGLTWWCGLAGPWYSEESQFLPGPCLGCPVMRSRVRAEAGGISVAVTLTSLCVAGPQAPGPGCLAVTRFSAPQFLSCQMVIIIFANSKNCCRDQTQWHLAWDLALGICSCLDLTRTGCDSHGECHPGKMAQVLRSGPSVQRRCHQRGWQDGVPPRACPPLYLYWHCPHWAWPVHHCLKTQSLKWREHTF